MKNTLYITDTHNTHKHTHIKQSSIFYSTHKHTHTHTHTHTNTWIDALPSIQHTHGHTKLKGNHCGIKECPNIWSTSV